MKTITTDTLSDLDIVAEAVIQSMDGRSVVAFYGAMGAGKTTLISAIMSKLGSKDAVASPTFALVNQYSAADGKPVYHFDFYRLNSISEAFDLGYEEYFYSGEKCFVEWPEKVEQLLPDDIMRVEIEIIDEHERKFTIE